MSAAVTVLSAGLVALALFQLPYAVAFVRAVWRRPSPPAEDGACPPALVVLSLRGGDETLSRCLTALIRQDYPRFEVRVVVDARDDPAWGVVRSVLDEHPAPNVRVEELRTRRKTCSLKCSSLLQAVEDLDREHGFVAVVDADVVPHETWLREMAAGLEDPSVGVVTGNRWYAPRDPTWGALVRWLWNLAAVPQMYVYDMMWGGTMAVRADLLESAGIRERWAHAYTEDNAMISALRETGHRVRFLPSLIMVDRSACTLDEAEDWVVRQMLSPRLHHPAWPAIVAHGLATSLALLLVPVVGVAALLLGSGVGAGVALASILVYEMMMLAAAAGLEWSVRRRMGRRGEVAGWLSPVTLLRCAMALPLAQALHARALVAALLARTMWWRGVRYELVGGGLLGGGGIRLVDDRKPRGGRDD